MKRLFFVFATLVTAAGLFFMFSGRAIGATVPFAFFIEGGLDLQYRGITDGIGPSVFVAADKAVHPIIDGKEDAAILGKATVILWMSTGSDTFFTPLQPVAALVQLDSSDHLLGLNLGAILTPSAVLTTIGVVNEKSIRGEWTIAPGTLAGGTDKDLIIGGLAIVGTPSAPYQANLNIPLYDYFPPYGSPVVSGDPSPTLARCLEPECIEYFGLFNGYTTIFGQDRPVRSYSYSYFSYSLLVKAHLMAVHTGGDGFYVVACRDFTGGYVQPGEQVWTPGKCTLSGTGQLAPYTGEAVYMPGNSVGETFLQLYNWNLVLQ
jgi:hypothetical protein